MADEKKPAEADLIAALRGLDKENLKDVLSIAQKLQQAGIKPSKVFPVGIPNPDGAEVHSILKLEHLQGLLTILKNPRIQRVRIFPLGIPVPDLFRTEVRIR